MSDKEPLFFSTHKKTSTDWDFKVPYIGRIGNRILDWIWLKTHRPKFTESNLETLDTTDYNKSHEDEVQ